MNPYLNGFDLKSHAEQKEVRLFFILFFFVKIMLFIDDAHLK